MRISACVIARDEADRIRPCLASLAFCDEIVVVDSGSTDGTQAICREAGARVLERDWPGWVKQKRRAVEAAQHDWVLCLDADERVDEALRATIEALAASREADEAGPAAYRIRRKSFFLGRWMRHGGWYPEWRIRLFDRRRGGWAGDDPHDRVETRGEVASLEPGHIEHHTYRSVADHIAQMNRFSTAGAEAIVARGGRGSLLAIVFRPLWHFFRAYILKRGFLAGWRGWVHAALGACSVLFKYVKVRELAERRRRERDGRGEGR